MNIEIQLHKEYKLRKASDAEKMFNQFYTGNVAKHWDDLISHKWTNIVVPVSIETNKYANNVERHDVTFQLSNDQFLGECTSVELFNIYYELNVDVEQPNSFKEELAELLKKHNVVLTVEVNRDLDVELNYDVKDDDTYVSTGNFIAVGHGGLEIDSESLSKK